MTPLQLAGIDLPLAPIVLGTMIFGDGVDLRAAGDMIEAFVAAGGTGIDTANGWSESMLGELLDGRRDRVVLASEVGIPHPDACGAAPLSIDGIRRGVTGSLRRLGADHLDLLYLHQPDRSTPIERTMSAIRGLRDLGLIRACGVSDYAALQIAELIRTAADHDVPNPVIAQQVYNVVATRLDDEYAEYASTTGLPTVVCNPLAGGLLTGKHHLQEAPGTGRFGASRLGDMYRARHWNDTVLHAIETLRAIADQAGLPMAELALRWTIGRPVVNAVLIGGSRPGNIRANLAAIAKGPLSTDLDHAVSAISITCEGQCPLQPLTPHGRATPQVAVVIHPVSAPMANARRSARQSSGAKCVGLRRRSPESLPCRCDTSTGWCRSGWAR